MILNLDFSRLLPAVSLLCGRRGPSGRPLCRVRLSVVASTVLSDRAECSGRGCACIDASRMGRVRSIISGERTNPLGQ